MLHTFRVLIHLRKCHIDFKNNVHGSYISINQILKEYRIDGIKARLYTKHSAFRCSIFIDAKALLRKDFLVEADSNKLKELLSRVLEIAFGDRKLYEEHNLTRLDYSFDIKVPCESERKLLLETLKKHQKNYRRLRQDCTYQTTIYYKSKSVKVVIYDKNSERKAKNEDPFNWEIDVLRVEVQLMNTHLYNRCKRNKISKIIESFLNKDLFLEYLNTYLFKLINEGDYHTLNSAKQLVSSLKLKANKTNKLIKMLTDCSTNGIHYIKEGMDPKTFKDRISSLDYTNLNLVTLPDDCTYQNLKGIYNRFMEDIYPLLFKE